MSRRRDIVAVTLANAVLRLASRQYRERLATLIENGLHHRAPAPKVNPKFGDSHDQQ